MKLQISYAHSHTRTRAHIHRSDCTTRQWCTYGMGILADLYAATIKLCINNCVGFYDSWFVVHSNYNWNVVCSSCSIVLDEKTTLCKTNTSNSSAQFLRIQFNTFLNRNIVTSSILMHFISCVHQQQVISAVFLFASSLFFIGQMWLDLRYDSIRSVARTLAGFANGVAYMTVITHAAENAVNQIRGIILRGIGYVLAFSLFIAGATTSKYLLWDELPHTNATKNATHLEPPNKTYNDYQTEFNMGVLNCAYSIFAIVAACYLTIESAPFLLRRVHDGLTVAQREALVIATMVKLRSEKGETPKIRSDFIEMKHQLNEDQLDERLPFNSKNLRPLLVVIGVRVLSVCAKNLPFSILAMMYFNHMFNAKDIELELLFMLLCCRFFLGMFTMFFIDKFECKKFLYISAILCGFLMLIACIVVLLGDDTIVNFNPVYGIGMIIFFVFGSMSIDCVGHVQASEAFSYATKSASITIANTIEHAVHLIFIFLFMFDRITLTFVYIALGLIVLGTSTLFTVPARTKGLSLRQTRDIYRKVHFTLPRENA